MIQTIQKGKLPVKVRAMIARSLAALIITEPSIGKQLANLSHGIKNRRLRSTLLFISEEIKKSSVVTAIIKNERLFGTFFTEIVKIGDSMGTLPVMLIHLADYYDQHQNLFHCMIRKTVPPLIMLAGSVGALISLMALLVPVIIHKIATSPAHLPSATEFALKTIAHFQEAFIPGLILLPVFFCIALVSRYCLMRYPFFEKIVWHIPGIGALIRLSRLERFFSALSTALSNGIPEKHALLLSVHESKSRSFIQILHPVTDCSFTETLESLLGHLEKNDIIPPLIKETIQAADSSSGTGAVLKKVTVFYQETMMSLLNPALIILPPLTVAVTGLAILALLLALYLPFFATS
jgi:type II secretory pathway component PulF